MTQLHLQYALEVLGLSDASFAARLDGILAWLDSYMREHPEATETDLARALLQRWRRDLQSAADARGLIDLAMRYRAGGGGGIRDEERGKGWDTARRQAARPDAGRHRQTPPDTSARAPLDAATHPEPPFATH